MGNSTANFTLGGVEAVVDSGPWHYGVDYTSAYFRASKTQLQELLPRPLVVDDGTCVAYVSEFVSVSENRPDAVYHNPETTIYHEAAIGIGCTYNGHRGVYFPVMWVDKDWSLIRGFLNGYAKRLADQIIMTRLHPLNPALKPSGIGSSFSGHCIRDGRRIISVSVKVQRKGNSKNLVSFGSTYGVRRFPVTHKSQREVWELVEVLKYNSRVSDVWIGRPQVEAEGINGLRDFELLFGANYRAGFSIRGARVIKRFTA